MTQETFEQIKKRLLAGRDELTGDALDVFADAIRSELAKQAGSVEPLYTATALAAQAAKIAELEEQIAKLKPDAERYQWLREQHWSEAEMCVVVRPKDAVKLGHYCPFHYSLDAAIDAARNAK